LSGLLASAGATVAGYFLAREVFNLKYAPDPLVWVVGIVGGALLVGVAGVLAARSVVTHPPVETLRQLNSFGCDGSAFVCPFRVSGRRSKSNPDGGLDRGARLRRLGGLRRRKQRPPAPTVALHAG
jgi:hypothetical protein